MQLYPIRHTIITYNIQKTDAFNKWLRKLKDIKTTSLVLARIKKIEIGKLGGHKSVGKRVSEMRIDHGPRCRIYFTRLKDVKILFLGGPNKSAQARDIKKAQEPAAPIPILKVLHALGVNPSVSPRFPLKKLGQKDEKNQYLHAQDAHKEPRQKRAFIHNGGCLS